MPEPALGGLTPEQAVTWKYPCDPQMSPNGDRVAFVLRDVSSSDEYPHSAIWMADTASDNTRQFTFGPREDKAPRWSPDGQKLAFVSDRADAGKPRLYLLPAHGGEAAQVPWNGETSDPRWSPDGRHLAFLSKEPETPEDKERIEKRRDHVVADGDYKFTYLYIVPADGGGDVRRLSTQGANNVWEYAWLPDSSGIIALVTDTPRINDISYGPSALIEYPIAGEPHTVLRQQVGMSRPEVSPDGTQVAFLAKAGRVSSHDAVWVIPRQGGEPQCRTRDFEGSVDCIVWSADGRDIRFVGYQGFHGMIGTLDVRSGEIRDLLPSEQQRRGSFDDALSFDQEGTTFAVVRSASDSPPNIFLGTLNGEIRQVTHLNEHLSDARYSRGEIIEWPSGDLTIQGMLYRPLDWKEGERCPLVVEVHGGPAWMWSDRFLGNWHDWAQLLAARGFAVLCPNPRGSTGRGHRFTDGEVNDMGGMELTDILCGVDHVLGLGLIDETRVAIAGWSHGGYIASWAITQTDRFRAAVVGAGVSNMVSDQGQNDIPGFNVDYFDDSVYLKSEGFWQRSPLAHIHKAKTPTLILHGEKDDRVTQPQAQELYRALQHAGVTVEFITYPREGHSFKEREHQLDLMQRLVDWLDRHLAE